MKPTLYVVEIYREDSTDWDIAVGTTGDYEKDKAEIIKGMIEEEQIDDEDVIDICSQRNVWGYDIILKKN